ncbi:MAG: hypothetical protein AABY04_04120, partial [Candidatus Micrarchaeota archaeon]
MQIQKFKKNKGFMFTMDLMYSLSILSILALILVTVNYAKVEDNKNAGLENLARDFLEMNYLHKIPTDYDFFSKNTYHSVYGTADRMVVDFNGNPGPFFPRNGTWVFAPAQNYGPKYNGLYSQLSTQGDYFQAIAPALSSKDYYVEVQVNFTKGSGNEQLGGISIRANSNGIRYSCLIYANKKLILWKADNWNHDFSWSPPGPGKLNETDISVATQIIEKWVTVWMSASGNLIYCGIKEEAPGSISAKDNSLIGGYPSLESTRWSANTQFDNFTIKTNGINASSVFRGVLHSYPAPCGCSEGICQLAINDP